jgi:3-methyladenine DNA glycosylase AlkD
MTIKSELKKLADKKIADHSVRFFKCGPGEYGEGDLFLGIRVPVLRKIAKDYIDLELKEVLELAKSKWHEERLTALFILTFKYQKYHKNKDFKKASGIYKKYISLYKYINNWDLVDTTCHKIMGPELIEGDKELLYKWARSNHLWKKRIAMMTTYYFIKRSQFDDAFAIAEILLADDHDLIHKVVGWMLREIGKIDRRAQDTFMKKYYQSMPRTMLRYAIEKYPENTRKKILAGNW